MSHKHKKGRFWGGNQGVWPMARIAGKDTPMNQSPSVNKDVFTCIVDDVSACSRAPKISILIDSRLWQAIVGLCEHFDTEWLAYLTGQRTASGNYEVEQLNFPEQTAGGAHVRTHEDAGTVIAPNTIGAIHSHVGMTAAFSSTDIAHANWPVEIVVNREGKYETSVRVTLPCGGSMRIKSQIVLLTGGQLDSMEERLKEALEKGKAKEPPKTVWPPEPGYGIHGGQHVMYGPSWQGTEARLLGGKYLYCPICGGIALRCPHTLTEMDIRVDCQKRIAP